MSNQIIGDDGEIFSVHFGGNGGFSKFQKNEFWRGHLEICTSLASNITPISV